MTKALPVFFSERRILEVQIYVRLYYQTLMLFCVPVSLFCEPRCLEKISYIQRDSCVHIPSYIQSIADSVKESALTLDFSSPKPTPKLIFQSNKVFWEKIFHELSHFPQSSITAVVKTCFFSLQGLVSKYEC